MSPPQGIRYYGGGDLGGYGQAAIANVRALVNAGLSVHWVPLDWTRSRMVASSWTQDNGKPRPLLQYGGAALADLDALVARTRHPIDCDTIIAHSTPVFWPYGFEAGKFNVGCTAWEADRLPAHWLPLAAAPDTIVVPSELNRKVFCESGVAKPVEVIPHIRRHIWNDYPPSELAAARADLGIGANHRVFYSINRWDPRKALPELIEAFVRAFRAEDPVSLVIKTNREGTGNGPYYPNVLTRKLAEEAVARIAGVLGRSAPQVIIVDDELDSAGIDLIHGIGDVYISLSHGEAFGLGAFEAATLGKPVLMTGWGGQTDFLGENWPGRVPFRMSRVPIWPTHLPSYFPSQRWATADLQAATVLMQRINDDPLPFQVAALEIRERIVSEFAEPVVVNRWLRLLEARRTHRQ